jgi:hypothetical protein
MTKFRRTNDGNSDGADDKVQTQQMTVIQTEQMTKFRHNK